MNEKNKLEKVSLIGAMPLYGVIYIIMNIKELACGNSALHLQNVKFSKVPR